MGMYLDGRCQEFIFSGETDAEVVIGAEGSGADLEVPGWTSGRAVGWYIRCASGSAVGLRWSKAAAFAAASGNTLASYEDLAVGEGVADEWLNAGTSNQQLRVGPSSAGTVSFTGRVLVRVGA